MSAYAKQFLRKTVVTALAAGSLLTVAVESLAQEVQQPQPESPWVKLCGRIVVTAKGQTQSGQEVSQEANTCRTLQERLDNKDAQIAVAAAMN